MMYLGDFAQDATVYIYFTTHAATGAAVAPLSAFEAADVKIYKNGSNAEKTTANGVTMTSPFDTITGLHLLAIDTSNDTGDGGFWATASDYSVVLSPDETVDGLTVVKVLATFSCENRSALRPTTAGRTLDVSAGGEAGVDWANVGSPTTTLDLSGTTIATTQKVDVNTIKTQTVTCAGGVTVPAATLASTTNITAGTITTATNVTTVNGLAAGVITATAIATDAIDADAISADAITEIQAGLSTAAVTTAIKAKTDSLTFTVAGQVDANIQYVNDTEVTGDGETGTEWGPA